MSPKLEYMLVNEVIPRLKSTVGSIPKVGHEDDEEIVQDATLMAARMMEAAEHAGRTFTAGNMAHYATKAARSGRRSYYAGRSDVMSPGCQIAGMARHEFLDMEHVSETGEAYDLHDVVPSGGYQGTEHNPAEEAARNLDWEAFLASHSPRHRAAITVLLEGGTMREAGKRCGLKDSAALNLKRKIAEDLLTFFGADVIRELLGGVRPAWDSDLRLARERSHSTGEAFHPLAQASC